MMSRSDRLSTVEHTNKRSLYCIRVWSGHTWTVDYCSSVWVPYMKGDIEHWKGYRKELPSPFQHCSIYLEILAGELSLSCARLMAGRVTTLWVRRPLSVNQHGQLSLPSLILSGKYDADATSRIHSPELLCRLHSIDGISGINFSPMSLSLP